MVEHLILALWVFWIHASWKSCSPVGCMDSGAVRTSAGESDSMVLSCESAVQLGCGSKKQTLVHLKIMVLGLLQVAASLTHSLTHSSHCAAPVLHPNCGVQVWTSSGMDSELSPSLQLCLDQPHHFHDGYKLYQRMNQLYTLLKHLYCVQSAVSSAVPGNWISSNIVWARRLFLTSIIKLVLKGKDWPDIYRYDSYSWPASMSSLYGCWWSPCLLLDSWEKGQRS